MKNNINLQNKRKLFAFWFGPKMSKDRKYCFDSMVKNSGVETILITEDNLKNYIVDPLYEGFNLLSSTHKSAYLRPYFMKYYGGAYFDIKYLDHDLNPYFDLLENSDKQFIGYQEKSFNPWSKNWEEEYKLAGVCRYIFKPQTPFANEWYDIVLNYLNLILPHLKQNPGTYHPRAVPGGIGGFGNDCEINPLKYGDYPIPWGKVFSRILQEVMIKDTNRYMLGLPFIFKRDANFVPYR